MPHTPSEDYKELQDFIEKDRQKTQIRDKARAEPDQQERDWQRLVDAIARIRDYPCPLGDRKWDEDRYEHLVGLRKAFDKAGKGEALEKLPAHGYTRQLVVSLLELVKLGDRQQALDLMQSIHSSGDLDRELFDEWHVHLPRDLQGILIPLPPAFDFLLAFALNAAQFHALEKLSASWLALYANCPALLAPGPMPLVRDGFSELKELLGRFKQFAEVNGLVSKLPYSRPTTDTEFNLPLNKHRRGGFSFPINTPLTLSGNDDVDVCDLLKMAIHSIQNLYDLAGDTAPAAAEAYYRLLISCLTQLAAITPDNNWLSLEAWKCVAEWSRLLHDVVKPGQVWTTTWMQLKKLFLQQTLPDVVQLKLEVAENLRRIQGEIEPVQPVPLLAAVDKHIQGGRKEQTGDEDSTARHGPDLEQQGEPGDAQPFGEALTDRQCLILETMQVHDITSERRKQTRAEIVRLINRTHNHSSYGREFAALAKRGTPLLKSCEGPQGGYWLTREGIAEAKRLHAANQRPPL